MNHEIHTNGKKVDYKTQEETLRMYKVIWDMYMNGELFGEYRIVDYTPTI